MNLALETRHCTLCGPDQKKRVKYPPNFSEEDLNAAIFSARRMPDRRHFQLMECLGCGMIYSDPACDPSMLAKLYQESQVNYEAQEEQIYQSYRPVLDKGLDWVERRGTFLEIGGGSGFMLRYGVETGFEKQIEIEPSSDAEKRFVARGPNARFIRGIFVPGILPPRSVSYACFFQMLDHVPNPAGFLESVLDVLEPGGVAVCVTHNTQALSAKVLGERSPIFDIEHTYLFNPENMSRLFRKIGFEAAETFEISNNYSLAHWMRLAPFPKVLKGQLLSTLAKTRVGKMKVRLRAGNFAIVGKKSSG